MTEYLFGSTSTAYYKYSGVVASQRYTAPDDCDVTQIRVYCKDTSGSANVKVAIYADDGGGNPGSLLNANNGDNPVSNGWNLISITSTALTSGNYYHLAAIGDELGCITRPYTSSGNAEYYDATYSGFSFPSTWPGGSGASYEYCLAAYGEWSTVQYEDALSTINSAVSISSLSGGRGLYSAIGALSGASSIGQLGAVRSFVSGLQQLSASGSIGSVSAAKGQYDSVAEISALTGIGTLDGQAELQSIVGTTQAQASLGSINGARSTVDNIGTVTSVSTSGSLTGVKSTNSSLSTIVANGSLGTIDSARSIVAGFGTINALGLIGDVSGGREVVSSLDTLSADSGLGAMSAEKSLHATPSQLSAGSYLGTFDGVKNVHSSAGVLSAHTSFGSVGGARTIPANIGTLYSNASLGRLRAIDRPSDISASASLGILTAYKSVLSSIGTISAFCHLGHPSDERTWVEIIPLASRQDNYIIIRDKIAEIIAKELLIQQSLATDAGLDPNDYKADVYLERMNPWERYRDNDPDTTTIINVWYDGGTADLRRSTLTRTLMISRYNIDCISYAVSTETESGHTAGDEASAKKAQQTALLVRRIIMHPKYKMLGLENGVVWNRIITSATQFKEKPESMQHKSMQQITALQLVLEVEHVETIDIHDLGSEMDHINVKVYHEPDGLVRSELLYR